VTQLHNSSTQGHSPADIFGGAFFIGLNSTGKDGNGTMDFSKLDGLIPAVIQDATSNEVLMVGFMNQEAWDRTRETGFATFFSRTRNKLWMKGETSGNTLSVKEMRVDCDDDTVLLRVTRNGDGNVCHTGERTCFYRAIADENT
jgi:phosphoribosyl-AMP cyclohydrolase